MDLGKLVNTLLKLGTILLVVAFLWWASYWLGISDGASLGPVVSCLYSSSVKCSLGALLELRAETPIPTYEPMVFWAGLVLFVVAIVLKLSIKQDEADSSKE